jgi:flavin reductase (DIM6/NTAB) family NADH-FMN oxidoreductase RutF
MYPAAEAADGGSRIVQDAANAIDPALFRKAMGSFATGVTVITTEAGGEIRGMTANAFMSGSLCPPLCVISVARAARMHGFLEKAGHFGVSILATGHERLCAHFAGRPDAGVKPDFVRMGRTPVLADAAATLTADIEATHDCGDHSIVIGRILDLKVGAAAPLIVHGGRFASLMYTGEASPGASVEFW